MGQKAPYIKAICVNFHSEIIAAEPVWFLHLIYLRCIDNSDLVLDSTIDSPVAQKQAATDTRATSESLELPPLHAQSAQDIADLYLLWLQWCICVHIFLKF